LLRPSHSYLLLVRHHLVCPCRGPPLHQHPPTKPVEAASLHVPWTHLSASRLRRPTFVRERTALCPFTPSQSTPASAKTAPRPLTSRLHRRKGFSKPSILTPPQTSSLPHSSPLVFSGLLLSTRRNLIYSRIRLQTDHSPSGRHRHLHGQTQERHHCLSTPTKSP
jgi:hypothetical protein